jgi:uncharacterized protein (TIGR03663 family)
VAESTLSRGIVVPDASRVLTWVKANRAFVALLTIVFAALLLRLYQLDAKALHHDESLHSAFTWYLANGRGYTHDPLMHGPFLFESGAGAMFLFGQTDFVARLCQALFGTLLVGMPWLLRKQLGTTAVLITAVFIAISPTLLYVSRFDRHDIFIVTWMFAMTICAWRYIDEHHNGWLYGLAGVLALSYATMEVTYINVAILLVFFDGLLAYELGRRREDEDVSRGMALLRTVTILPVAWLIAVGWPLLGKKPFGRTELPACGDVLVVIGTMALPQFAAGIQELPFVTNHGYEAPAENTLRDTTLLALLVASAIAGLWWKPKVWLTCAVFFYVPYILLYTTFFTNLHGLFSGPWGSLDYWLEQQDVKRGDQPIYYYSLMTPLYEYMTLLLTLAGAWWLARRGNLYLWFVIWFVGIFVGLSLAGEKMPWLEVHIALPLAICGGIVLARAVEALGMLQSPRWQTAAGVAGWTAVATLLLVEGDGVIPLLGVLIFAGLVAWAAYSFSKDGKQGLARAALTVVVAAMFVLTVRTSLTLSFTNPDVPVEMAVYTQTAPDIVNIRNRIDALAESSGMGKNLPILIDGTDSFSWPWAWYLRDYHDVQYAEPRTTGFQPPAGAVFLLNRGNLAAVDASGYSQQPYKHRWWFEETYRGLTLSKVIDIATSPSRLKDLGRFFLYRRPAQGNTGSVDGVALFPLSLVPDPNAKPVEPEKLADGRIVTGRQGAGPGELQQPGDVFVDRNGTIWVADGLNNRIVRYDSQGNYVGSLRLPGAPGPTPLQEPWSLAVDEQGFIYVADTWNHRIVKFSPTLQYMTAWGRPAAQTSPPGPLDLFGPRDIMIAEDGSILITDTGHNRLINYTRDGQPIADYGLAGTELGKFQEPVSLARDIQGRIYIADAWNGRIQRFERGLTGAPVSVNVPWTSHEVPDKPYIATLSEGRVVATVPENGSLLLFDANLRPIGTWRLEAGSKPIGVAPTADGGFVFTDSLHDQLQIVPGAKVSELFK